MRAVTKSERLDVTPVCTSSGAITGSCLWSVFASILMSLELGQQMRYFYVATRNLSRYTVMRRVWRALSEINRRNIASIHNPEINTRNLTLRELHTPLVSAEVLSIIVYPVREVLWEYHFATGSGRSGYVWRNTSANKTFILGPLLLK